MFLTIHTIRGFQGRAARLAPGRLRDPKRVVAADAMRKNLSGKIVERKSCYKGICRSSGDRESHASGMIMSAHRPKPSASYSQILQKSAFS